jgi:hypothetical protein
MQQNLRSLFDVKLEWNLCFDLFYFIDWMFIDVDNALNNE